MTNAFVSKNARLVRWIALLALTALCGFSARAVTTNRWIGAASGGSWSAVANWETSDGAGGWSRDTSLVTTRLSMAATNFYDFTALAAGATVTRDMSAQLNIAGMKFPAVSGTITLAQGLKAHTHYPGNITITVPTELTVLSQLSTTSDDWLNAGKSFVFEGGGTYRIKPCGSFAMANRTITVKSSTVIVEKDALGQVRWILSGANAWLKYTAASATFARFTDPHKVDATSGFDIGSGNICYKEVNGGTETFSGKLVGTGKLLIRPSGTIKFTGDTSGFTGMLVMNGLTLDYSAGGPGNISDLRLDFAGATTGDVDIATRSLSSVGVDSRARIAAGKTLTLGSPSSTGEAAYNARIIGAGSLVKTGDYTQTLSGDNSYGGATTVSAGELKLKSTADTDLCAYWTFDSAAAPYKDISNNGLTLTTTSLKTGSVSVVTSLPQIVPGRKSAGSVHIHTNRENAVSLAVSSSDIAAYLPKGNDPYTWTMWLKTTRDYPNVYDEQGKCTSTAVIEFLYQGSWGADGQGRPMMTWVTFRYNENRKKSDVVQFQHEGCNSIIAACIGLTDGNWHQLAFTYANRERKIYYDGVLKTTGTIDKDLNIYANPFSIGCRPDTQVSGNFDGEIDNFGIWRRALTAEEIKYEYDHSFPKPGLVSDSLTVPAPVAHWDFNDSSDPYKDTSGVSNLKLVADTTKGSCSPSSTCPEAFGGVVSISNGGFLKSDPDASWPARMPSGTNSFTLSIRARFNATTEKANVWYLGPADTAKMIAYDYLVFGQWSYPSAFGYMYSKAAESTGSDYYATYESFTVPCPAGGGSTCWQHIVTVYDAPTKTIRHYQDGILRYSKTLSTVLDLETDTLFLGHRNDLVINQNMTLDDVQVFDCALTAGQIEKLTRALRPEDVSGVILPPTTDVTIAENARLSVCTPVVQTAKSLAGAGTVDLSVGSELNLTGTSTFSGDLVVHGGTLTVTNGANVTLDGDLTGFTGFMSVFGTLTLGVNATNALVTAENGSTLVLPYGSAAREIGSLTVNGTVTLKPTDLPESLTKRMAILKADSITMGDGAQLKLAADSGLVKSELEVDEDNGTVVLHTHTGMIILIH